MKKETNMACVHLSPRISPARNDLVNIETDVKMTEPKKSTTVMVHGAKSWNDLLDP